MNKFLKITLLVTVNLVLAIFLTSDQALAASFNSSYVMSDPVFNSSGSMTASQIDSWLNSHYGSTSCISTEHGFKAPQPIGFNSTSGFQYSSGVTHDVSAGTIIYDAAHVYGLNPQVILATLEKEESLVSGSQGCSTLRYSAALGYGCPDSRGSYNYNDHELYSINGSAVSSVTGTCVSSTKYAGFSRQVIYATWQLEFAMQRSEGNVNWNVQLNNFPYSGDSWNNSDDPTECYNNFGGYMTTGYRAEGGTGSGCTAITYFDGKYTIDSTAVTMKSGATASLYDYTPHISGNQSFFNLFTGWFGSTTGSILFKVSGSNTYYLEWGGEYYPVPSTAMLRAYGVAAITPRTLSALPSGETEGPVLTRVVKFGSDNTSDPDYTATITLVDGGQRHDAPNWTTLNAYGYSSYVNFPANLSYVLSSGDLLRPVVRSPSGSYYLMQSGKKRLFPDWATFSSLSGPNYTGTNQIYSQQQRTSISSDYIDSISEGAPMLLDGKFIQPSGYSAIYLYDSGKKYLFNPSSYYAWGRQLDYKFSEASISQVTSGGGVPILISSSSGTNYLADHGMRKLFNSSSQTAWGLANNQFTALTFSAIDRLRLTGISNLVTGDGPTVFYIDSGKRHGIPSISDFYGLGFSWSNVDSVSSSVLSLVPNGAILYASGDLVRTPSGAVFVINSNYATLGITSGSLFNRFGFLWSNVRNIPSYGLSGYTNSGLNTLLRDSSNGSYYEIDLGVKHYVDTTAFGSGEYSMSSWPVSTADPKVLGTIKDGPQLTQFIKGSSSTVYYVENGQKRGITSASKFYSLGGSWSKVVLVSDDFLSQIPTGSNI